jgi:hypothetical protein
MSTLLDELLQQGKGVRKFDMRYIGGAKEIHDQIYPELQKQEEKYEEERQRRVQS